MMPLVDAQIVTAADGVVFEVADMIVVPDAPTEAVVVELPERDSEGDSEAALVPDAVMPAEKVAPGDIVATVDSDVAGEPVLRGDALENPDTVISPDGVSDAFGVFVAIAVNELSPDADAVPDVVGVSDSAGDDVAQRVSVMDAVLDVLLEPLAVAAAVPVVSGVPVSTAEPLLQDDIVGAPEEEAVEDAVIVDEKEPRAVLDPAPETDAAADTLEDTVGLPLGITVPVATGVTLVVVVGETVGLGVSIDDADRAAVRLTQNDPDVEIVVVTVTAGVELTPPDKVAKPVNVATPDTDADAVLVPVGDKLCKPVSVVDGDGDPEAVNDVCADADAALETDSLGEIVDRVDPDTEPEGEVVANSDGEVVSIEDTEVVYEMTVDPDAGTDKVAPELAEPAADGEASPVADSAALIDDEGEPVDDKLESVLEDAVREVAVVAEAETDGVNCVVRVTTVVAVPLDDITPLTLAEPLVDTVAHSVRDADTETVAMPVLLEHALTVVLALGTTVPVDVGLPTALADTPSVALPVADPAPDMDTEPLPDAQRDALPETVGEPDGANPVAETLPVADALLKVDADAPPDQLPGPEGDPRAEALADPQSLKVAESREVCDEDGDGVSLRTGVSEPPVETDANRDADVEPVASGVGDPVAHALDDVSAVNDCKDDDV